MKAFAQAALASAVGLGVMSAPMAEPLTWTNEGGEVSLKGALQLSVNQDECESPCLGPWRSTDPSDALENDESDTYWTSNFSTLEIRGSQRVQPGLSAIFRSEWKINLQDSDQDRLTAFEQWAGLKGGWGQVKAGRIMTPYMTTGNKMNPFRRTGLDTRFFTDLQSALHHGIGLGHGRSDDTIRYDSPKLIGNLRAQAFAAGTEDTAFGGGLVYSQKNVYGFAQYYDNGESGDDAAYKVGGRYQWGKAAIQGQYEWDAGLISLTEGISSLPQPERMVAKRDDIEVGGNEFTDADLWYLGLSYDVTSKIMVMGQYGERDDNDAGENGFKGLMVGGLYRFQKGLSGYAGYQQKEFNAEKWDDDRRMTVGMTYKF